MRPVSACRNTRIGSQCTINNNIINNIKINNIILELVDVSG